MIIINNKKKIKRSLKRRLMLKMFSQMDKNNATKQTKSRSGLKGTSFSIFEISLGCIRGRVI